jgi:hypothetical protein
MLLPRFRKRQAVNLLRSACANAPAEQIGETADVDRIVDCEVLKAYVTVLNKVAQTAYSLDTSCHQMVHSPPSSYRK